MDDIVSDKQKGGLGLKLIYSIMDIVNFYSIEDKNTLMMVKLLTISQEKPTENSIKKPSEDTEG